MKTPFRWCAAVLALALATPAVSAQESAPDPGSDAPAVTAGEMADALRSHADRSRSDRAVIERVLSDERVEAVARDRGLDPDRIRDGSRGLDGADLSRVADEARSVDRHLQGSQQSVTFSTTTIIIGLLVLILLILVLD